MSKEPKLLSGGNPQIAKGDGAAPVKAYIAAMPGWKRAAGERLDRLIEKAVPGVAKAMKWNSPLYGAGDGTFFLGVHCFNAYIKVAFFKGGGLKPKPLVESKDKDTRYFHIHETDEWDEAQIMDWVRQAAALPGWKP